MTNLEYFLTRDHAARQRTMLISVSVGALAGILSELLGATFNGAVIVCVLTVSAIEITRALSYAQPAHKIIESAANFQLARRSLLGFAYSAATFFACAVLGSSRLEAALVERKLREATAGDPPYDKANKLINSAIQNEIPAGLATVEAVRRKVIRAHSNVTPAVQESVNVTLAQLDAYEVYIRTGVKLDVAPIGIFIPAANGAYGFREPVYGLSVSISGEDRNRTIITAFFNYTPQTPALYNYDTRMQRDVVIGHLTAMGAVVRLSDAPEFVLVDNRQYKVAVLNVTVRNLSQTLESIIWADVTFNRCHITYHGGRLSLRGVSFNDCDFASDNASAQTVLDQIRLQGQRSVTLEFP